jgi:hypothetical protein
MEAPMNQFDPVVLRNRIIDLESGLGRANRRTGLVALLVLLSGGVNLWLTLRPVRELRVTNGHSTAELTPTRLKMTDGLSTVDLNTTTGLSLAESSGTGSRVSTSAIELERAGETGAQLFVVPDRNGPKGILLLRDEDGSEEALYAKDLSKLKGAPAKAEPSKNP